MLDWKVTEESNTPLPDDFIENEEVRPPLSRGWVYSMIAVVVLLVATVGGWVWWRFREGESALEQDLLVQIRTEESARRFGQTSRLNVLIADEVPQRWRERFASHFRTPMGEVEAIEVSIEEIEIRGEAATVWVRMGAQVQRRAYQMTGGGWRRVPLPPGWEGDTLSTDITAQGRTISLHYRAVDEAFATQLSTDLPALVAALPRWRNESAALRDITIRPQELEPGVIEVYFQPEEWVLLNSPEVVQLPTYWNLSGAAAVRYALAIHLLNRDSLPIEEPTLSESSTPLPGAARFMIAVRTITALRWALPPDEYQRLLAQWQTEATELAWQSPFFTLAPPMIDPFGRKPEDTTMLRVADTFLGTLQENPSISILELMGSVATWDEFFVATTGYTTVELEARAGGGTPAALPFPLEASSLLLQEYPLTGAGIAVQTTAQRHPIVVEGLDGATFTLPNGETWDPHCLSLFGEFAIEGEWLEKGRRLVASHITLPTSITLPAHFLTVAPPTDTVAYLAGGADTLMPSSDGLNSIVAITATGERQQVLMNGGPLPLRLGVAPSPWLASGSTEGILLTLDSSTEGCSGHWLIRFVPSEGITGAWLYRPSGNNVMLWDDLSGRGLLIYQEIQTGPSGEQGMPYWWLDEGEPQLLGLPDGVLPYGSSYALRPGATHIAIGIQPQSANSAPMLSLVALVSDAETENYAPQSPNQTLTGVTFSPDGQYLYTAWTESQFLEDPRGGSTVSRIHLTNGDSTVWGQPQEGAIYALLAHQTTASLYAFAYNLEHGLHLVKFNETERFPLAENRYGADISYALPCGNGGFLYLTIAPADGERPNFETDVRQIYIIPPDATEREQSNDFIIQNWEYPVLCR